MIVAVVLALAGAATAQTHAPWPANWSNWNDPALMATVGDPGNAADTKVMMNDGTTGYGAVAYSYKIAKFEVTAGQYTAFLNAVAATDTYGLYNLGMGDPTTQYVWGCNIQRSGSSGNYTYSVPSDWANRPVNYVSWGDAARFANWLTNGKPTGAQGLSTTEDGAYYLDGATSNAALMAVTRKANAKYVIPTGDEWYKAAYYDPHKPGGVGYWLFPTRSNTVASNVLSPTGTNGTNYYDHYGLGTGGYTIGPPYYRTEAGAFGDSPGPYGTFDQGGNIWEWNEAVIGSYRGLRGGSFYDGDGYYQVASHVNYNTPAFEVYTLGFRIAEVPEPASMAALVLGGLTVLRKRRK